MNEVPTVIFKGKSMGKQLFLKSVVVLMYYV